MAPHTNSKRTCLITGANGFIGLSVVRAARANGYQVHALSRSNSSELQGAVDKLTSIEDIRTITNWKSIFHGVDVIIHLAGLAHATNKNRTQIDDEFTQINVDSSLKLAENAAKYGASRFVFISSISVYPRLAGSVSPITESTPLSPDTPYGTSKLQAENGLLEIMDKSGLEVSIVRPSLVSGFGAPGNLERLARLIAKKIPIPVPDKPNRRSLIDVNDLADLIIRCTSKPEAGGNIFVAADPKILSTRDIFTQIGKGAGRKTRLVSMPRGLLTTSAGLFGVSRLYDKIYGDLIVDSSKAQHVLGWKPITGIHQSLRLVGQGVVKYSA